MDDAVTALEDAAFHAWLTFGELLADPDGVGRSEIEMAYAALQEALTALRAKRGAPPPSRP